jgi:hypothetical protein
MAAKKKEAKPREPVFDAETQRDQFMNTNDWPLYRPSALFRVKELGPDSYAVVDRAGGVQLMDHAELSATLEPVKGMHKGEF